MPGSSEKCSFAESGVASHLGVMPEADLRISRLNAALEGLYLGHELRRRLAN